MNIILYDMVTVIECQETENKPVIHSRGQHIMKHRSIHSPGCVKMQQQAAQEKNITQVYSILWKQMCIILSKPSNIEVDADFVYDICTNVTASYIKD